MYNYSCSCRVYGEVCKKPSRFILQWYSDKENVKPGFERRPSAERGVCADFSHMVDIVFNDNPYCELPQRLVDIETQDRQYPEILNILKNAVNMKNNPEMIELLLSQGDEALRKIPGLMGRVE